MSAQVAALQDALAGEHAALYAYGVLGGRAGATQAAMAGAAYVRHRARRDTLMRMLRASGARPVPAAVGYDLPFSVDEPAALRRLAVLVERRCAALYAAVVAHASGGPREFAARSLLDCATTALRWGSPPEPFPGISPRPAGAPGAGRR